MLKRQYPQTDFVRLNLLALPPDLQALVPATPMAVYLHSLRQVRYAGPFNVGRLCTSETSLVEAYVSGQAQQAFLPLAVNGCFCPAAT